MKIFLLVTPSFAQYDAVSNDLLIQAEELEKTGAEAFIYAQFFDPAYRKKVISLSRALRLLGDKNVSLIYHHSVYWRHGYRILERTKGRIFFKYHNITPARFFRPYDDPLSLHLMRGAWQTFQYVQTYRRSTFMCDSYFNAQSLHAVGLDPTQTPVVPPYLVMRDADEMTLDQELQHACQTDEVHILFVGRVAPNKGIHHLLHTLHAYLCLYGPKVRLHIVGGIYNNPLFMQQLIKVIEKLAVGAYVRFHGQLSQVALRTMFYMADVYLNLSEHEGFCVPIVEAQLHKLPVVAFNGSAVGETLGLNQCALPDIHYERCAAAIHHLVSHTEHREFLMEQGLKNLQRFSRSQITRAFTACLQA